MNGGQSQLAKSPRHAGGGGVRAGCFSGHGRSARGVHATEMLDVCMGKKKDRRACSQQIEHRIEYRTEYM